MNFIVENWYWVVAALVSGALLALPLVKSGGLSGVTAAQAVQLINREKAVVVDVCDAAEYASGHVGGAKNVPLAELSERLPQIVKNKTVPVILVCAHGARARRGADIARKLGYDKAQVLAGGLAAWREANLPVEKS